MLPEREGPHQVARYIVGTQYLKGWDGDVEKVIPGVSIRVEYGRGDYRAALDALDTAVGVVRAQIMDDTEDDETTHP